VRVRLLDSRISGDLLDINLYLSPFDIWNATLRKDPGTGLPNLITEDESCTYPDKAELQAGVDFQNVYTETTDDDLTEGYIEIIEMGEIADGEGPATDGDLIAEIDFSGVADGALSISDRSIPAGILHDVAGVPADCSVVTAAWAAGAISTSTVNGFEPGSMGASGIAQDSGDPALPYDNSHNAGLVAPGGGINAYAILINVGSGSAYVEEGVHIDRYTTVSQHYLPDDPVHYRLPSLASGDVREAYITNEPGDGRKGDTLPLTEYDTGALHNIAPLPSVPMGSNPLPISLILSSTSVSAPYFIEESANGVTDVVLTFPMRKHGIYNGGELTNQLNQSEAACAGSLDDGVNDGAEVNLASLNALVQDYPHDGSGNLCENAGYDLSARDLLTHLQFYDYEEGVGLLGGVWDDIGVPLPVEDMILERSVNVNTILSEDGGTSELFGSPNDNDYALLLFSGFKAGWLKFIFSSNRYSYILNDTIISLTEPVGGLGVGIANGWSGVPVIGFAAMSAVVGTGRPGETIELIRKSDRN
ncbi:MAG: hypothetical protein ABW107_02475, partial [Candidatus Thiodiazotropha sp. 6PLUC5]